MTTLSNDDTLHSLTVSGVTISPTFSSTITSYTAYATGLAVVSLSATAYQTAIIDLNGVVWSGNSVAYNLNGGQNTILIKVTAEDGVTNQTYTLIIVNSLTIPIAENTSVSVIENSSATTISVTVVNTYTELVIAYHPLYGTASANGLVLTYQPELNYVGLDSFSYVANGPGGSSNIALVSITVLSIPIAANAISSVIENSSNNIIPLDITNPYISLSIVTTASNGTVSVSGRNILYTPNPGFYGTDSFEYTATGTGGVSTPATNTVNVTPLAPVANNSTIVIDENSSNNTIFLNVDYAYDTVTIVDQPIHGVASASGGNITYTPNNNYLGNDSLSYYASGVGGTSNTATVTIVVASLPIANNSTQSINENSRNTALILNIQNQYNSVNVVSNPSSGTVYISGTTIYYSPTYNYTGIDSLIYDAVGTAGTSNTATVTLDIFPFPVAKNVYQSIPFNSTGSIITLNVINNYTAAEVTVQPSHGTVSVSGTNIIYVPNYGYSGPDRFTYTVSKLGIISQQATVYLTVLTGNIGQVQWITPAGLLLTCQEDVFASTQVLATAQTGTIYYKVISGSLPSGMSLTSSTGVLSGTPNSIFETTTSTFVIRAFTNLSLADRTFEIITQNTGGVFWFTTSTFLPVGIDNETFVFNNQWVDYQLNAIPITEPSSASITYRVTGGELPGGLTLSSNGILSGFVSTILTNESTTQYVSDPTVFQFNVSATDGFNTATETFNILVLDPNTFRSDDSLLKFNTTGTTATVTATISTGSLTLSTSTNITLTNSVIGNYVSVIGDTTNSLIGYHTTVTNITNSGTIVLSTGTLNTISSGSVLYFYSMITNFDLLSLDQVVSSVSFLQPAQFINGSNLGIIRANNNADLDISAYNPSPLLSTITYTLVTGTTISTQMPYGLTLDTNIGHIYGFIPYQPAYTRVYNLTVEAHNRNLINTSSVVTTNTFMLTVAGNVFSSIEWISTSSIGSIETGIVSELYVLAEEISSTYTVRYELTSGALPAGLVLERDGTITGSANSGTAGVYTFTVLASDVYELSAISQEFTLLVTAPSTGLSYTSIYIKPFLSSTNRQNYQNFINNTFTFDPSLIYRYYDTNFGVQQDLKLYLEYAIQELDLKDYAYALTQNFYKRSLYFGDVKVAIAQDLSTGKTIYEVVYLEINDPLITNTGASVTDIFYQGENIYYPGSVTNMRKQLENILVNNTSIISVNNNALPLFMNTAQAGSLNPPGYIPVVVLCYAMPGKGTTIANRIKLSGFDFTQLSFEIDRIIVSKSLDNVGDKYLILERQSLSNQIIEDNGLFGLDGVELTDQYGNPITRE